MNSRLRWIWGILLSVLLLVSLTGCWDDEPLESRDLVLSMGFYPSSHPHMFTAYFSIPTPSGLSSAAGGSASSSNSSSPPFTVLTGQGYSLGQAFSAAQAKTQRDLYLGHTIFLIFSTKLSPTLFSAITSSLDRIGTLDKTPFVSVTTAPYKTVVGQQMPQETFPAEYYNELFSCTTCQQLTLGVRFWQLMDRLRTPGVDPVLPFITSVKNGVAVDQVALYRHRRFIVALTPQETAMYGFAAGASQKSSLFMPKYWDADLDFVADHSSISTQDQGTQMTATIKMTVTATLESINTNTETAQQISAVSRRASAIIASSTLHFLERTQTWNVDPLGVGRTLSWSAPNAFYHYRHWHNEYPHVHFIIHCVVKINKMGDIR